ncbi:inorganic phosphate transporter [Hyphomicrobium sp.]|uniref:inorganic phosphate transporter n=1 Tax=Hyphomicrobium sp. TaxID=82 RepID=UPI002C1106F5|nr:inorganic phosphate transporter [Hyphomicrobium sp.]HRN89316.1 inorganic phosphate transporter [Hyphomicrobium sp.]HRQ26355.1 inorganic phosphate transporter [Hyphomicrobium sp.]
MAEQDRARRAITPRRVRKLTLDKDLGKIERLEQVTRSLTLRFLGPGIALVFIVFAGIFATLHMGSAPSGVIIVAAAVIAAYMALTIGANDVANNVGPAVGARALTMTGALIIAAVFESAGALIAGGEVVETISKGLVDPAAVPDSGVFIWIMMSALLASAIWVHLATLLNAPVSTTHAIVGGVLGSALAAMGMEPINWPVLGAIAASWVISPLLGGLIAALLLAFIKVMIIYREDKIAAARRWVPVLTAVMAGVFGGYLVVKGLGRVWKPAPVTVAVLSLAVFALVYAVVKPLIRRQSEGMENRNQSLRRLFHLPLICSAALLSFGHGANDVANAVGPLAAILNAADQGSVNSNVAIPLWAMMIGALGISLGLLLFGPRLIRLVGEQITKMNPMRAFCVALSAAITVIVASWFGMPVSSTHIAVGAIFGVGFFREYWTVHSRRRRHFVRAHGARHDGHKLAPVDQEEFRRRRLVRRSHLMTIVAAWVVTVPAAATLSALTFLAIQFAR